MFIYIYIRIYVCVCVFNDIILVTEGLLKYISLYYPSRFIYIFLNASFFYLIFAYSILIYVYNLERFLSTLAMYQSILYGTE